MDPILETEIKTEDSTSGRTANMYATQGAGTIVLAAGVSAQVLFLNRERRAAAITNAGANPASLTLINPAVAGSGIYLLPGGAWTFGRETDFDWRGEVYAISTLGTTLSFVEI